MGIRVKLVIALGGLLLIMAVVGMVSIHTLKETSQAIARILRENHDSVVACGSMRIAIDKLDHQAETLLWGNVPEALQDRDAAIHEFEASLKFQQGNVTVKGEQELTDRLAGAWKTYRQGLEEFYQRADLPTRRDLYRQQLLPRSREVREIDQKIIDLNLNNMVAVDGQAQKRSAQARKAMILLLVIGLGIGAALIVFTGPAILQAHCRLDQVGAGDPEGQPGPGGERAFQRRDRAAGGGLQPDGHDVKGTAAQRPGPPSTHPAVHQAGPGQPAGRGGHLRPQRHGGTGQRGGPEAVRA